MLAMGAIVPWAWQGFIPDKVREIVTLGPLVALSSTLVEVLRGWPLLLVITVWTTSVAPPERWVCLKAPLDQLWSRGLQTPKAGDRTRAASVRC